MNRLAPFLMLLTLTACNEVELVSRHPMPGAVPIEPWSDSYQQSPAGSSVDILWVVDNSGSMADEQEKLAASFEAFITHFTTLDLDFRIAVVTTDVFATSHRGAFRGDVLTPSTPDLADRFLQQVLVGTDGSGREQGLEAARLAFARQPEFIRADALLSVIVVSDEEDQSEWSDAGGVECAQNGSDCTPVATYVAHFKGLKPVTTKLHLSTITGDAPGGCSDGDQNADAGLRYAEAISQIAGSAAESICAADFGPALDHLGHVISSQAASTFGLTYPPVGEVTVLVDDSPVAAGETTWHLDAATNAVVFAEGAAPAACSHVTIVYDHAVTANPAETSQGPNPECPIGAPDGAIDWQADLDRSKGGCSVAPASSSSLPTLALLLGAALLRRRKSI